jgi:hypothetical protein
MASELRAGIRGKLHHYQTVLRTQTGFPENLPYTDTTSCGHESQLHTPDLLFRLFKTKFQYLGN